MNMGYQGWWQTWLGGGMEVCWHIQNSWLLDASPRDSLQTLRGLRTEGVHGGLGEVAAPPSPPASSDPEVLSHRS